MLSILIYSLILLPTHAAPAATCSAMKSGTGSCFIEYNGLAEKRCEVCREGKSCFMALFGTSDVEQGICEAYIEDKSCFMALNGKGSDYGWCEVVKEGKSCFMALDGTDREACENGDYPSRHLFWAY